MAPPLYFFPRIEPEKLKVGGKLQFSFLAEYDLAGVLADIVDVDRQASVFPIPGKGPNGGSGTILTTLPPGKRPMRLAYVPEFQQWVKVRNRPVLWVGLDTEYPVTPADLVRHRTIRGHAVELADGNRYEIPVIRSPARGTLLPQNIGYDLDGELTMEIKPSHIELWERTGDVHDWLFGANDDGEQEKLRPWTEIMEHCLRFMGVNYRYGKAEQTVLHLIDDTNHSEVLAAAVDVPFLAEAVAAQKKTTPESAPVTPSSVPGPTTEPPATPPVAPNSS